MWSEPGIRDLLIWFCGEPARGGRVRDALREADLLVRECEAVEVMLSEFDLRTGCVLLNPATISEDDVMLLADWIGRQESWSDLPILLMTDDLESLELVRYLRALGNATPLDVRLSDMTVLSQIRGALRARLRQFRTRQAMEQLRRTQLEQQAVEARLRQIMREREAFYSILAHDLKHPVVGIAGMLGLLHEDLEPLMQDEQRRNFRMCVDECDRLRQMLRNLGDLGRIGRRAVVFARADLRELAEQVAHRFSQEAKEREIRLHVDAAAVAAEFAVGEVTDALNNLMENALKYGCPRSPCEVKLVVIVQDDGQWARFEVIDQGDGIADENLERIFHPFVRVARSSVAGSGMGLASVKTLMDRIGGEVTVQSGSGGSRFTLRVPLRAEAS